MVRTKVWCECFQGRMGSDNVRTRSRDNSLEEFYYGVQRNIVVDRSVNRARRTSLNIVESWTSCHLNPYISLATAFYCDTFNHFALIVLHFLLPLMILLFFFFSLPLLLPFKMSSLGCLSHCRSLYHSKCLSCSIFPETVFCLKKI